MGMDSLDTSHPLSFDVYSPSQISGIFDNISYNKGASVLRMVQHLMGATNFQSALRSYLKTKYTVAFYIINLEDAYMSL